MQLTFDALCYEIILKGPGLFDREMVPWDVKNATEHWSRRGGAKNREDILQKDTAYVNVTEC